MMRFVFSLIWKGAQVVNIVNFKCAPDNDPPFAPGLHVRAYSVVTLQAF